MKFNASLLAVKQQIVSLSFLPAQKTASCINHVMKLEVLHMLGRLMERIIVQVESTGLYQYVQFSHFETRKIHLSMISCIFDFYDFSLHGWPFG